MEAAGAAGAGAVEGSEEGATVDGEAGAFGSAGGALGSGVEAAGVAGAGAAEGSVAGALVGGAAGAFGSAGGVFGAAGAGVVESGTDDSGAGLPWEAAAPGVFGSAFGGGSVSAILSFGKTWAEPSSARSRR